ncbi:MAG: hypothetical protein NTV15_06810 [Candidatus Bathyarchaeota archaeon]|nr:hypothetical protein [Candidatus Bathyarchaeota archaeon]
MPLRVDPVPALLTCDEPWVRYSTLINIIGKTPNQVEVDYARSEMLGSPQIKQILTESETWPDPPISRHNDAKHPIHKLAFLADWGIHVGDPGINEIIKRILEHQEIDGPLQSNIEINRGQLEVPSRSGWLLCDYPTLLYVILSFGASGKRVDSAAERLAGLVDENGWRCRGNLGFRGPGRKTAPCPYANLIALKALSLSKWRDSDEVALGVESQLTHLEEGVKHYLFGVGSDFRKLKYPNIWYDCLHVAEALSRIPAAREDLRFKNMWMKIIEKQEPDGGFVSESIWKAWVNWSFGQKKQWSPSLTCRIALIDKRLI